MRSVLPSILIHPKTITPVKAVCIVRLFPHAHSFKIRINSKPGFITKKHRYPIFTLPQRMFQVPTKVKIPRFPDESGWTLKGRLLRRLFSYKRRRTMSAETLTLCICWRMSCKFDAVIVGRLHAFSGRKQSCTGVVIRCLFHISLSSLYHLKSCFEQCLFPSQAEFDSCHRPKKLTALIISSPVKYLCCLVN